MSTETLDRHEFKAETRALLRLMIHSMYSNREIFLRELISNASDACDKLRFESIAHPALLGDDELRVRISIDKDAHTLTISDNGVGMTREEAIEHLGTIAKSGTKAFLEQLSGDQQRDAQLIGQFGVGFYSAFIVADSVTVRSLSANGGEAVEWISAGEGEYTVNACDKDTRGTDIVLHLREDDRDFENDWRVRDVVRRYSDHIGLPIQLLDDKGEWETINQARAFWTRPKSELSDEDYKGFYKHIAHDMADPMKWGHHRVEGNLEYTSLLYIPSKAPFDLWDRDQARGVQLYVKRVFIMDKAAELLPPYLRFVRGLVDTADLPLNVSREILQNNRTVEKIRSALVKRVLDMLDEMAEKQPEDYAAFYAEFGKVLKEGIVEDHANRERIAKLLRYPTTTHADLPGSSLSDYVARMPTNQDKIYYVTGESLSALRSSPHLEGFRKAGFEVLLMADRIDEWVVGHLHQFGDKSLESVASGASDLDGKIETFDQSQAEAKYGDVLAKLPELLGGRIESARVTTRLTESPSCLVAPPGMSRHLIELLKQAGEKAPDVRPVLEVNPEHPLVARLNDAADPEALTDLAEVLFGQAVLAEGAQLENPAAFVKSLNRMLLGGDGEKSRILLS